MVTRILFLLACIIVFILALIFSVQNFHSIEIHLYFTTISLPLVVALTIELLAGVALGAAVVYLPLVKLKAKYAELSKKLNKSQTPST